MIDLNPKPPAMCRLCGKRRDYHRAQTLQCPTGSFSRTLSYSTFHPTQVFELKTARLDRKSVAK